MLVHAMHSIDNSITGGPDTFQYDSDTSVVQFLVQAENIPARYGNYAEEGRCSSPTDKSGTAGFDCHFFDVDLQHGGSYTKYDEDWEGTIGRCSMTISPAPAVVRSHILQPISFGGAR